MELTEFDPAENIKGPDDARIWLETFLDDGTPEEVASAIGDIARAYGIAEIAKQTGISVQSLFKALNRYPQTLSNLQPILAALGVSPAQRTDVAE